MLSDRKYMNRSFRDSFSKSHTDLIIIFLIITFIINSVLEFTFSGSKLLQIFAFSNISFPSYFVWTPFTYSFFHDGPFHLIFNLLGIHFISRQVETDIGPNNFRWLVGICVIWCILWLLLTLVTVFWLATSCPCCWQSYVFLFITTQSTNYFPFVFPSTHYFKAQSNTIFCNFLEIYGFILRN